MPVSSRFIKSLARGVVPPPSRLPARVGKTDARENAAHRAANASGSRCCSKSDQMWSSPKKISLSSTRSPLKHPLVPNGARKSVRLRPTVGMASVVALPRRGIHHQPFPGAWSTSRPARDGSRNPRCRQPPLLKPRACPQEIVRVRALPEISASPLQPVERMQPESARRD